jgi:TonB family protein
VNWSDEAFEEFLRRFQPSKPRAIRAPVRYAKLAIASVTILAAAIPAHFMWKGVGTPAAAPIASTAKHERVRAPRDVPAPKKIFDVKPVYPADAKAAGVEGVVLLDITIGEDGGVEDASILKSIPELDQAAIDAVLRWKFEPTLDNGTPVEVLLVVSINFTTQ